MTIDRPISAIAVDDEPLALQILADDLSKIDGLKLVRPCAGSQDALDALKSGGIDVMFLDIQMPGLTGTQLLRTLEHPPLTVMTTAYENYAVEGFELDVVDYLVKPIPFDRLLKAVDKVRERLQARKLLNESKPGEGFFFIRSEYKEIKILFDEIRYVEGLKDYVKIFLEGQTHPILTRMNLKGMESRLPAHRFVRVHNSFIVPFRKITAVQRSQIFVGEDVVPVGEKFYPGFIQQYKGGD